MNNDKENDSQAELHASDSRRRILKGSLAAGGMAATATLPFWNTIALAQGEQVMRFTDMPEEYIVPPVQPGAVHYLDSSEINTFYTDNDDFYIVQHYNQPAVADDEYSLSITGLVQNPITLSLADIKARPRVELDAGFECGGNSARIYQGLIGNARWAGCRLKPLLEEAGIRPEGIEIVFYGNDMGEESVRETNVTQAFGRSMHLEDALMDDVMLAYEMNGEPLPLYHGAPLRLLVPGWYGVANVKWLGQIHVQDRRYMGRFMARDYVTLSKREIGGQERWEERSVTRILLKSSIVRVTQRGDHHNILGFVLNDGTPLDRVEISIDGSPWQRAEMDSRNSRYSWKLFNYRWDNAQPGEHTVVSRVIDSNGQVQPTAEEMPEKVSRWENNGQFPRTVLLG